MRSRRLSFWIKVGLLAAVVAVADALVYVRDGGPVAISLFSLAWVAALAIANPAVLRDRLGRLALLAATLLALLPLEAVSLPGVLLFLIAGAVAALAPRAPRGDDAWRWAQRVGFAGLKGLIGPILDLSRLAKARTRIRSTLRLSKALLATLLPVAGGLTFLFLFISANPVLTAALRSVQAPEPDVFRLFFWAFVAVPVWMALRPRGLRRTLRTPGLEGDLKLAGVTTTSILASLVVFNLVFAVQNGLDLVYLWSGAGLPKGVSFSEYAHQGAQPLIATALLAGLFVLVFLRPGSSTALDPRVRVLVIAWVAQNLFLVASTALRTVDYVQAYSLTEARIVALLWMALVATGLALICWRLLAGKSSSWLINTNIAALGVVLAICSVVDLGALSSAWNVRHAREVGGRGVALDLCYLDNQGMAALVSLAELERDPRVPPELKVRAGNVRRVIATDAQVDRKSWLRWTFRDQRRWDRAHDLIGPSGWAYAERRDYRCDGHHIPETRTAPAPAAPATPPLTPSANPGT